MTIRNAKIVPSVHVHEKYWRFNANACVIEFLKLYYHDVYSRNAKVVAPPIMWVEY